MTRSRPSPTSPDTSRGVTITLSARTGIHHTAGRVAICGNILKQDAGDPKPAHDTTIWQRSATSLGARVLPNALNAGNYSGTGQRHPRRSTATPSVWSSR